MKQGTEEPPRKIEYTVVPDSLRTQQTHDFNGRYIRCACGKYIAEDKFDKHLSEVRKQALLEGVQYAMNNPNASWNNPK